MYCQQIQNSLLSITTESFADFCVCVVPPAVWSSDPPVLLYPSLLPLSLTSLEALDVWCMEELPASACFSSPCGSGSGSSSSGMRHNSSYRSFSGLCTRLSSVGSNLCNLAGSNSSSSAEDMAAAAATAAVIAGADAEVLISLAPAGAFHRRAASSDAAGCLLLQQQPVQLQPLQLQQQQEVLLLRTPHLQRLVLRSTSPCAERQLHMPDLRLCSSLESLELHHSQLNQCHLQHIAASCPASLRSLKLVAIDDTARIRASGLTILTRLSALTDLSVHAHERAINKNVRKAISSMAQLRSLTLLTSPDYPTSFARNLACLTQLTNLMVLRVGLGFGALDALRRLGSHVSKALPHCTYQMLTDTCTD
jgi:hypothetical protein